MKSKHRWIAPKLAVTCLALTCVVACAYGDPRAAAVGHYHVEHATPFNRVAMLTRGLEKRVSVDATGNERGSNRQLSAWATFRNREQRPLRLAVRIRFFTQQGQEIEASAWKPIFLAAQGGETYRNVSKTADAALFMIEVREDQ